MHPRAFVLVPGISLSEDLYGRGYSDAPEITTMPLIRHSACAPHAACQMPKAHVAGVSMVRACSYFVVLANKFPLLCSGWRHSGGIYSFFPDLVDSNVALIAPTGLVEVTHVIYLCAVIVNSVSSV